MANSSGFDRLRAHALTAQVSLAQIANDLADYAVMRPDAAQVLDGVASYLSDLHSSGRSGVRAADPNNSFVKSAPRRAVGTHATALVGAPSPEAMLPGEAGDATAGVGANHWVNVYGQLVDAAEMTGVGLDVQVHLLSRLAYWQNRVTDATLLGRRSSLAIVEP